MNSAATNSLRKYVLKLIRTGDTDKKCFDRQPDLLEATRDDKKHTIIKMLLLE